MATTSTIKFLKTRKVKSPSRAYDFDAGIDLYVPEFCAQFIKDLKEKNPEIFPEKENDSNTNHGCLTTAYGNTTLTIMSNSSSGCGSVSYSLDDKNDSLIKFNDITGENYFILSPGQRVNIPSGIKLRMSSPGRAFIAFNKSGVATKLGLVAGACVVDYLYQGEIHLSVINTSTKIVRIYENMKLLQFIEIPVFNSDIEVLEGETTAITFYKGMKTDRGADGFGSSDKK